MEARAVLRAVRLSAQKGRLVADQIRGKSIEKALDILRFSNKKAGGIIEKVLKSAIANAENNLGADIDELKIKSIFVDEGSMFKRAQERAKGRRDRISKPTCHITVIVSDENQEN